MTWVIPLASQVPEKVRLRPGRHLAARRPLLSRTVTTSSSLPTPLDHLLLEPKSASKNILLHSSVPFAPRSLLVLTISDRTFALIRTSDHSYVQCVAKLSLVNMIARGTRVYTAERRSSFAVVSLAPAAAGDAADDLLERTHSAGTSEAKLAGCASNRC